MKAFRILCCLLGHRYWLEFHRFHGDSREEEPLIEKVNYRCSVCGQRKEVI